MGGKGSGRPSTKVDSFTEPKKRGRPKKDQGEKRGPGRPKKGEIVDKPFTPHVSDRISENNELMYAKKTISEANRAYRKYANPLPNPLNIEAKDLCDEAKAAWKYVYSLRGYEEDDWMNLRERTIANGREANILFEAFCDYIRSHNFAKTFIRPDGEIGVMPIVPSQTNFARWLGMARRTVTEAMLDDGTDIDRSEYRRMLADMLSEGGMMGVYQTSMTIFTLKNLCDWADKYEDRPKENVDTQQTVAEAQALMESLGYKRLTDG